MNAAAQLVLAQGCSEAAPVVVADISAANAQEEELLVGEAFLQPT
jgi:hypothetical protein